MMKLKSAEILGKEENKRSCTRTGYWKFAFT